MPPDLERLIDSIYEAALVPEQWTGVLHAVTDLADGAFASLFVQSRGELRWIGTPEANALIADYVALGRPDFNSRIERAKRLSPVGFISDQDIFSFEEMNKDPFYTEFLRPRGYGWVADSHIVSPSGDMISISSERRFARGPFTRHDLAVLNQLGPHLARASLLSARLGFQRAKAMAEALQMLGLPGATLRESGRLSACNPLFEALMPAVFEDRLTRVTLTDENADALLAQALTADSRGMAAHVVASIPIPAVPGRVPFIVHVVPVFGVGRDIFSQAAFVVVVTPVDRGAVPTAEVVQGLFDLTPAEARTARAIAEGRTTAVIAAETGLSQETIRSQLKSVFAKTGLNSQSKLANLLSGKALT